MWTKDCLNHQKLSQGLRSRIARSPWDSMICMYDLQSTTAGSPTVVLTKVRNAIAWTMPTRAVGTPAACITESHCQERFTGLPTLPSKLLGNSFGNRLLIHYRKYSQTIILAVLSAATVRFADKCLRNALKIMASASYSTTVFWNLNRYFFWKKTKQELAKKRWMPKMVFWVAISRKSVFSSSQNLRFWASCGIGVARVWSLYIFVAFCPSGWMGFCPHIAGNQKQRKSPKKCLKKKYRYLRLAPLFAPPISQGCNYKSRFAFLTKTPQTIRKTKEPQLVVCWWLFLRIRGCFILS